MIEALIYGDSHDNALRNAAKGKKDYSDVLAYPSVVEVLDEILKKAAEEKLQFHGKTTSASTSAQGNTSDVTMVADSTAAADNDGANDKLFEGHGKLSVDDQDHWQRTAQKLLRQYVKLAVTPTTKAALQQ